MREEPKPYGKEGFWQKRYIEITITIGVVSLLVSGSAWYSVPLLLFVFIGVALIKAFDQNRESYGWLKVYMTGVLNVVTILFLMNGPAKYEMALFFIAYPVILKAISFQLLAEVDMYRQDQEYKQAYN